MATYVYYYLFSVIFVMTIAFWIANLVYLRSKGKSFFGHKVKPGTLEHKGIMELASNKIIAISTLILVLLTINLGYSISRLLRFNPSDSLAVFIYGTGFVLVMGVIMFFIEKYKLGNRD